MTGSDARARRKARRPHLGRLDCCLCARLRPRGRGRARHRGAAAGRAPARPDGRARAHRQPSWRFRRDLQRRVVFDPACAMRDAARIDLARRQRLLRSSADDGPHRARRRRGGSRPPTALAQLRALIEEIRRRFPELVEVYDNTASLQDRTVTTGILKGELARQFGAGGHVGRASGRAIDVRRTPGYPPYDTLQFDVPVFQEGDVNARVWVRIREIEQSLGLIEQILARLPEGPIAADVPATPARHGRSRAGRILPRRCAGLAAHCRRPDRALPSARPVLVSVAAARGCGRGQHRRGLSPVQQVVQLFLFGA